MNSCLQRSTLTVLLRLLMVLQMCECAMFAWPLRMDRQERVQEDVKISAIQQVEKDYKISAACQRKGAIGLNTVEYITNLHIS